MQGDIVRAGEVWKLAKHIVSFFHETYFSKTSLANSEPFSLLFLLHCNHTSPPCNTKTAHHFSGQICQNKFWNVVHQPSGSNKSSIYKQAYSPKPWLFFDSQPLFHSICLIVYIFKILCTYQKTIIMIKNLLLGLVRWPRG